jgi:hypothetical protein
MQVARNLQLGGVGWYPHSAFFHIDTGPVRNWTLDDRGLDSLLIERRGVRFNGKRQPNARTESILLPGMEQSGRPLPRLTNSGRLLPSMEQSGRQLAQSGRPLPALGRSRRGF